MAKTASLVIGIVFLIVGILGFIPNGIVGDEGTFMTNGLHDSIHILFGLILLFVSVKAASKASTALKVTGIIYLILAIIGFIQGTTVLGIIPVNGADNWLHLVLGVVISTLGFTGKKDDSMSASAPVAPQM